MISTPKSMAAAIAANRFGLGAKPGELAAIKNPREWLERQVEGAPPVLQGAGLEPSSEVLKKALQMRRELAELRRGETDAGDDKARAAAAAIKMALNGRPVYIDEACARFSHAVTTDRPFLERITQFWTNHFAVSVDKVVVLGVAGAMEREAIRPNVTGSFTQLLLAVEKHPAMLLYLDNQASIGPNSRAAKFLARRRKSGDSGGRKADINENLAREILELHTLGVDGGYTQTDVTTFAKAITGWSIGGDPQGRRLERLGLDPGKPGEFHFREEFHEPGAKRLSGRSYGEDGVRQGEAMLESLAMRPETARHVSAKLARHFIADDPPREVVERMTRAWLENRGRLSSVYRAMLDSPEAWSEPLTKYKTPADYIHSAYRALAIPVRDGRRALQPFEALGQRNLAPGSPAGWPDTTADWDGSSALLKRVAWADAVGQRLGDARNARELAPELLGGTLSDETARAIARAESGAQALTLLLVSPEFMRR